MMMIVFALTKEMHNIISVNCYILLLILYTYIYSYIIIMIVLLFSYYDSMQKIDYAPKNYSFLLCSNFCYFGGYWML